MNINSTTKIHEITFSFGTEKKKIWNRSNIFVNESERMNYEWSNTNKLIKDSDIISDKNR